MAFINKAISRPAEVPEHGLLTDILWADPSTNVDQATFESNDRGVSVTFGSPVIEEFLDKNNLDMICRAHQVVEDGYEFYGSDRRLVTVFSAPNYCGKFDNKAAVLCIDQSLCCKFQVFKQ